MKMRKYETNYEPWHSHGDTDKKFWSGADGADLIRSYVNRTVGSYGDRPGIEQKLDRVIDALGLIADKSGINLLEVFDKDDLELFYRLRQGE
jgi:hypothetical protein